MKEVVSLHIGQTGCQVAQTNWELFCLEHGIKPDGSLSEGTPKGSVSSFFEESCSGSYVPRSLLIDLEPSVVDTVRTGAFKGLFHPETLITGKEDAANNFSRGKYSLGREIVDFVLDKLRKLAERCDSLQGFILNCSIGGGTGSGLGSLLINRMQSDYKTVPKVLVAVLPSPQVSNVIVEPYNAVLSLNELTSNADVCFMMDNEALYDICRRGLDIASPTYFHLNNLISQTFSSLTTGIRFDASLNSDVKSFASNLVPFPRINFLACSYAPLYSPIKAYNEMISVNEITLSAFEAASMMAKFDPRHGKFMAVTLMYRGDIVPKDINASIMVVKSKKTFKFVDWCPTGIKCGLTTQKPSVLPNSIIAQTQRSVCMACNSTAIGEVFKRITDKFDLLYAKRAFIHWFVGEGLESGEMAECRENMAQIIQNYAELNGSDEAATTETSKEPNATANKEAKPSH